MDVVQGDLENVRLLKNTIKTSLGPNGLHKLLVDSQTGSNRIIQPSHNLYEKLFISLATLQSQVSHAPQQQEEDDDESLTNEDEYTDSNYLGRDKTKEDSENNNNNNNNYNTKDTNKQQQQQPVAITSMVGALLRAQQYMLQSTKDGTTSVVLLGAGFLEIGHKLHREGISRHLISENIQKGLVIALKALDEMHKKKIEVNWRSSEQVCSIFEMVLSNKLARRETKVLSQLFATAVSAALNGTPKVADNDNLNSQTYNFLSNVHLCSCVGGDISMSNHVSGFILPYLPVTAQISIKTGVRVAIFATPLQENTNKAKLKANLNTPQVLKQWQKEEESLIKETALRIADTGANLVLTVGTIHKYILHWLDARGIVAIQSIPKNELISISEATGAKLIYQPSFMDSADLGTANSFETQTISGQPYSYLSLPRVVTILIRGPTQYKTQQLTNHCYDALAVVKEMKTKVIDNELCGTLEVIAGGGVPEMNASSALSSVQANNNDPNNSDFLGQYIMNSFAEGFEIIPKTLLENAGAPNHHYTQLKNSYEKGDRNNGITKDGDIAAFDVERDECVFDLMDVKKRIWATAVDVASMLLLVDDSIVGNPMQY